jgi:hypothetical protein
MGTRKKKGNGGPLPSGLGPLRGSAYSAASAAGGAAGGTTDT